MAVISGGRVIEGALKRQPAFTGAAAPVNNTTGLGVAAVGDQYMTTAGVFYVCTVSTASVCTWVAV